MTASILVQATPVATLATTSPAWASAELRVWLDHAGTVVFPGRLQALRALALADICPVPSNVLFLGPPGTAKTAICRAYADAVGHAFGAVTLSAWTESSALEGAVDVAALKAGVMTRLQTPGLLTTSTLHLLDELPRAGRGVKDLSMNALANRRLPDMQTPVTAHVIVATANTRLVDEDDQALADRFSLRVAVPRVGGADLRRVMLRAVPVDGTPAANPQCLSLSPGVLQTLRDAATTVSFPGDVASAYHGLAEALRLPAPSGQRHPDVSERRWVLASQILQAAATLEGRDEVAFDDLLSVLPMVLDDGEDTRPAVAAAIAACVPAWISALADLRRACADTVSLARLIEVDAAPVSPAQAQAHAKREASLDALCSALAEHGADAVAKGRELVLDTLDTVDDVIASALKNRKSARR
jgi:MoxR-like ATPase